MRQVVRPIGLRQIDVVALHPAEHLRPARGDLRGLAAHDRVDLLDELAIACGTARRVRARSKPVLRPVGKGGVDGDHVVHHVAVAYRARTAGVVSRHAADRRLRRSGYIHWKPQAVGSQESVELIEHDAGLDGDRRALLVELDDAVEVFGVIDDERRADGLTALRSARAARQDRDAQFVRDPQRAERVLFGLWHDYADGLDLVDRRVGRVASAARAIEEHLAGDLALEARGEARGRCAGLKAKRVDVHASAGALAAWFIASRNTSDGCAPDTASWPLKMKNGTPSIPSSRARASSASTFARAF